MSHSTDGLKAAALELGFTTVGIAPADAPLHTEFYEQWLANGHHATMDYMARSIVLRRSVESLLPGCRSVVAVTLNYHQTNLTGGARIKVAQYALGRDYHKVLRGKLKRLADWITASWPGSECRPCVDSAPVLEREWAYLAGLGWFGKNTMLIDSHRGSWFFIGLLLTTAELTADQPSVGGCGTCRACTDACPTGAIVFQDDRWQVDARSCISYLTIEHRGPLEDASRIGEWTFGCDVCQEVCPFNQPRETQPLRARQTTEPDFLQTREWPTVEVAAEIEESSWDILTQGSPLRRTGLEGIRRNARANLQTRAPRRASSADS